MSDIKKMIVGETTAAVMRAIFDYRIAQESTEPNLNTVQRAGRIKNLKAQIMAFIKRNHNGLFRIIIPEYMSSKTLMLEFTNFNEDKLSKTWCINSSKEIYYQKDLKDKFIFYTIEVHDNFVQATIIQKVNVGKNIVLRIEAER